MRTIFSFVSMCALLFVVYFQINYIKADWCSWEVEKGIFLLEDILNKMEEK
jgi:hypothetical protein